jgi:8-oxo-dGTP pyrophosphatase MutT (NUDIX family)
MKKFSLASGILPIAANTKNLCLSWRAPGIRQGDVWGIVGGMVEDGSSVASSALREMGEEVGYYGPIELHQAHISSRKGFQYHSFIGIVPEEFEFKAEPEYLFETSFIAWLPYSIVIQIAMEKPHQFHPGLLELLRESDALIRRFVQ